MTPPQPRLVQIAANDAHTCVLDDRGAITCWGTIDDARAEASRLPPTLIEAPAAAEIVLGDERACLKTPAGEIYCGWLRGEPWPITGVDGPTQLDASVGACAVDRAGAVWCWSLSRPNEDWTPEPERVEGLPAVERVSVLGLGGCATTREDRALWCWGHEQPPAPMTGGEAEAPIRGVSAVVTGPGVCVQVEGQTQCTERKIPTSWKPNQVVSTRALGEVVALAPTENATCGRTRDGAAFCFGSNYRGVRGHGTGRGGSFASRVPLPGTVLDLAGGSYHACALLEGNEVYCWGAGDQGQLVEHAAGTSLPRPMPLGHVEDLVLLSQTCALTGGVIVCTNPNRRCSADFEVVAAPPSRGQAWADWSFARLLPSHRNGPCMLTEQSRAKLSEPDAEGMVRFEGREHDEVLLCLGDQYTAETQVVLPAGTLASLRQLVVYHSHACLLDDRREVSCFSMPPHDLDLDLDRDRAPAPSGPVSPRKVEGLAPVEQLSGPSDPPCALDEAGKVWCWNVDEPSAAPERVPLPPAKAVATGDDLTCVIGLDGRVTCQGYDFRENPEVAEVTDARVLVSGQHHACAIDGQGAVWCWGGNAGGARGAGPQWMEDTEPNRLTLPEPATELVTGARRTCARLASGAMWCWGNTGVDRPSCRTEPVRIDLAPVSAPTEPGQDSTTTGG